MSPEGFRLCTEFIGAGGAIRWFPEGISGPALRALLRQAQRQRAFSARGWLARFGAQRIPAEAVPFILAGQLSVPQARVRLVWSAVEGEPLRAATIAERVRVDRRCVEHTLGVLLGAHRVDVERSVCGARYRATGAVAPDWREFVRARRAA